MFYYYGAKRILAPHYPRPRYRTIVEPFAGSAQYAVRCLVEGSADRAILVDRDPRVVEMWQRLLAMTPAEVLSQPPLEVGATTADPLQMVTAASNSWGSAKRYTINERMATCWPIMLAAIASALPHITGRVSVSLGDYGKAEQDAPATYFVDPPYQTVRLTDGQESTGGARGRGYAKGCNSDSLDFAALGEWTQSLAGHVIAVDQVGADWLPFRPLKGHRNTIGTMHLEAIWAKGGESQGELFDLADRTREEVVL